MEPNFIHQVIKLSLILALICLIILSGVGHPLAGLAILCGAAWGTINLFLLKVLLQHCLALTNRNYIKIGLVIAIKFPLLYLTGYQLLRMRLPILNLLLGFSIILIAIVLKCIGTLFLENKGRI